MKLQDQDSFQTLSANKVLYLDFDGVLHDEQVYFDIRKGIVLATPGRTLFEWLPILEQLVAPHPMLPLFCRRRGYVSAASILQKNA